MIDVPSGLAAEEFLRWNCADYEEAILAVTGVWEHGHGAYIEFADEDGPTRMSLVIVAALRMAAVVARKREGEKHAEDDGAAAGAAVRGDDPT